MLQYRSRVLGLILLLMFAGTLLGPAQIQASPLTQTAPTGPQLLIPTWGASPGGVWHYTTTTATWTLKNNGLPGGKFWFWIAADPSNSARWLLLGNSVTNDYGTQYFQVDGGSVVMADGATTPLWLTQDAGQTWTAVALPATGSLTEKIRIRRVEWSETVNGQWMLAWGIDRIERDGYEVLTRGTVGSGSTSIILFGPDRGTGETSALPGANGEIVIHDIRGNGIDSARVGYVEAGTNVVAGYTDGPWITFWNYLERLPWTSGAQGSRGLVGVPWGGGSGLWATGDYHVAALTHRVDVSGGYVAPTRDGAVYVAGGTGIQRVDNVLGTPVVTPVSARTSSTGFIRADRKNHAIVAAIVGGNTEVQVLTNGCTTWEAVPITNDMRIGGLANRLEVIAGTTPIDTDCDALPDDWEINGYQYVDSSGTTHIVDLPAMGAHPDHKDIFVEADWMADTSECTLLFFGCVARSHKPYAVALELVTQAFTDSPVNNPDGVSGIDLHIDAGPNSIMNPRTGAKWGALSQGTEIPYASVIRGNCYGPGQTQLETIALLETHLARERLPVFRYAVFGHTYMNTPQDGQQCWTGSSTSTGNTFTFLNGRIITLVTLAVSNWKYNDVAGQAGTLMHELGHALSLDHGGPTKLVDLGLATSAEVGDQNYKPNYFSVMNYAYQVGNLLKQQGTNRYDMVIDYSRSQLNNLVENQLDELVGVPSQYNYKLPQYWCDDKLKPAINLDWNCDGDANDNPVQADINRPKNKPAASASDTLRGFADWPYLKYDNGPIGRPGITADPDPASEYISHDAADDELIPLMRAYDVTVQGEGTILVRPGTSFLYTLVVKNTGLMSDTYTIAPQTPSSSLGWMTFSTTPVTVMLEPGQQTTFPLTITVPFGALTGVVDELELGVQSATIANTAESGILQVKADQNRPLFRVANTYAVGSYPQSVTTGDFNGDGLLDLVAANKNSNNVSVLLGASNGTFQAAVQYAVGGNSYAVMTGDFNGDGKLDLVTGNYNSSNYSSNVSVLLGVGNGTFQAASNYTVPNAPQSVTIGDFNGDGKLDVVTANYNSSNVSVLLGAGNGTFQAAVQYAVGGNLIRSQPVTSTEMASLTWRPQTSAVT